MNRFTIFHSLCMQCKKIGNYSRIVLEYQIVVVVVFRVSSLQKVEWSKLDPLSSSISSVDRYINSHVEQTCKEKKTRLKIRSVLTRVTSLICIKLRQILLRTHYGNSNKLKAKVEVTRENSIPRNEIQLTPVRRVWTLFKFSVWR
jgi:hypothetical protein